MRFGDAARTPRPTCPGTLPDMRTPGKRCGRDPWLSSRCSSTTRTPDRQGDSTARSRVENPQPTGGWSSTGSGDVKDFGVVVNGADGNGRLRRLRSIAAEPATAQVAPGYGKRSGFASLA